MRAMAALSSGHAATDFANGALPALLPFFVERFDLSYTLAATLMLASAFSSSVIQPFFGLWSDRRGAIWLLPPGVATPLVLWLGLSGGLLLALPGLAVAALLVTVAPFLSRFAPERRGGSAADGPDRP